MVQKQWTWHFDAPPDAVWAVMADTARFNEAAGFPKHEITEEVQDDGSIAYVGHARIVGRPVRWRDIPIDWVEPRRFTHANEFIGTPIRRLSVTLELTPEAEGTRGDYRLEIEPRTVLGRLLTPHLLRQAEKRYARLVGEVQAYLQGKRTEPFSVPPTDLSDAARERVTDAVNRIAAAAAPNHGNDDGDASAGNNGLAARLASFVQTGPEVDLMHIRPLKLARTWGTPERETIETCLDAVRAGLLGMDWQILCPRCRGAKATAASLDALPNEAHCASCNVDYERDFSRNVELTFHPAPSIRAVDHGEFCLFGPMSTPHVKLQQNLEPGETREIALDLAPGAYRFRTLNGAGDVDVEHDGTGLPALTVTDGSVVAGARAEPGRCVLANTASRPQTAIVEEREWVRDALTAHRVTSMQRFRDLFGNQILRPGDEVPVERIALMFTDLERSTELYGRIGDARAYQLVREHFAFLTGKVREHDGGIVKTIGDAVMAAFADPADALRAAIAIQRDVDAFNLERGLDPVAIKVGLHEGTAVAVTLNDRLDYFGSTVNLAARLQDQSTGGDIIVSKAMAGDPGVAQVLNGLTTNEESAALRGITEPVPFLRLRVGAAASTRASCGGGS